MTQLGRRQARIASVMLLVWATAGTPAFADGLITPFVGVTFGGNTTTNQDTYGISIAGMAAGVFGFELDAARTGRVFGDEGISTDGTLTTVMGNLLVGAPLGPVRPYAVGGLGLIRTSASGLLLGDTAQTELGVDMGAGLMGFFSNHVGARVDVRYFRTVTGGETGSLNFDLGDVDFWRASVGATFRF
jgi:hypothetical protein